jgi:hypothetical protein
MRKIYILLLFANSILLISQPVPAHDENIPFLMTFGPQAETSYGDDDFSQTFFFQIPDAYKGVIYIRVFDPDVGGLHDEKIGVFNTRVTYSVYGGVGCFTDPDAKGVDPIGNYKSGKLLAVKSFGQDPTYDNNYYTFGPFNATEGEHYKEWGGHYFFKIICEGISGDDGNLYRYFLSVEKDHNKPVEGGNALAFEYSFRMHDDPNEVSHIYPYVDDRTISIKQANFDWDNDGVIRVVSVARQGQIMRVSGDNEWAEDELKILEEELNTSLDFQFIKRKSNPSRNNNVVVNVKNQYGESLPFFVVPLGGVPKYNPSIGVRVK